MSIPLWAYLYTQYKTRPWIRLGIMAAIALSAVSAIGSHSRGAVVAIIAMAAFLWLKSRRKLALGLVLVIGARRRRRLHAAGVGRAHRHDHRPRTEESANSRLETWTMLWNLAVDRPLTGGGFETYRAGSSRSTTPVTTGRMRHIASTSRSLASTASSRSGCSCCSGRWSGGCAARSRRMSRGAPGEHWAYWLAQMIKVSIVAYLVGGAFQNLAYWDVPYYLFVAIAVTRYDTQMRAERRKAMPRSLTLPRNQVPSPGPCQRLLAECRSTGRWYSLVLITDD